MTMDHEKDHAKQQHEGADAPAVVPSEEVQPEGEVATGQVLAIELPDDLAELARRRRGLTAATMRRLLGQYGEDAVRGQAGLVAARYPTDAKIRTSFAALLTRALSEGWTDPAREEAERRAAAAASAKEAAPPPGTRWGRHRATGEVRGVERVAEHGVVWGDGSVELQGGWLNWEWLSGAPDEGARTPLVEDHVGGAKDEGQVRLWLVLAWVVATRPTREALLARLAERGITWADWLAFELSVDQASSSR